MNAYIPHDSCEHSTSARTCGKVLTQKPRGTLKVLIPAWYNFSTSSSVTQVDQCSCEMAVDGDHVKCGWTDSKNYDIGAHLQGSGSIVTLGNGKTPLVPRVGSSFLNEPILRHPSLLVERRRREGDEIVVNLFW